jgi:hypothetical protein
MGFRSFMQSLSAGINAGVVGFREASITTNAEQDTIEFSDWNNRRARYALFWALYENTVYRNIHNFARAYKANYGLYSYVRSVYSPAQRLGTFYQTHLMGGSIDPLAGDGSKTPSALPITTDNAALRPAIARLWRDSNWQIKKNVLALQGTVNGDVGIEVVDDPIKGRVYLEVVHAGKLSEIEYDPYGNVKGYCRIEQRADPDNDKRSAEYKEEVTRDGDSVVYQTYKNGSLYAWNGETAEWVQPYGFVPLVMVQHNNVGLDWGWSIYHSALPKIREVDDMASALGDYVRKMVNAPMLYNFSKGTAEVTVPQTPIASRTNLEPGRQTVPAIYVNQESAKGQPLVTELNITAVGERIRDLLTEIEEDYPELKVMKLQGASGDASGKALRYAQQPASTRTQTARANYESALIRAQQMAIAIGGYAGYDGYQGFNLDSYEAGKLDHSIGERSVFAIDPLDRIEEDNAFWSAAKIATSAGYALELYLADQGWEQAKINKYLTSKAEQEAKMQAQMQQQAASGAMPMKGQKDTPSGN